MVDYNKGGFWKPYDPKNPPINKLTPKQRENHQKLVGEVEFRPPTI
jgi:hypothetical protein